MGTEIKTWQIIEGKLQPLETSLKIEKRTEPYDLEPWLESNPSIIGDDIVIIGRQVKIREIDSKSGRIDFLGIDKDGSLIVIELKRDTLPREAIAQAIDYASDVASWSADKVSEVCNQYTKKTLQEVINDSFPDVDMESINNAQRIILVGFGIESSLERMVEWLSNTYSVNINAVILNYIKTAKGEELLLKTSIISEEVEQERVKKQRKFVTKAPNVTLQQLVDKGLIKDGQTLYFFHGKVYKDEEAEIVANENKLRYKHDGELHSISELAKTIDIKLGLNHGEHDVAGPKYWKTEDDKLLHDLNEVIRGRDQ